MGKFIIRRLILGAFIVFFGAMIAYAVIRCMPQSFVETMARQLSSLPGSKSYEELLAQLNEIYMLDGSILEGFFNWCGHAIIGDFGDSWKYNQPVVTKFNSVIWYSVIINILTFVVQTAVCIPLGILAVLGFGPLMTDLGPFDQGAGILGIFDTVTNSIMMPIAAILTCVFIAVVIKTKAITDEVEAEGQQFRLKGLFEVMIKFACPIMLSFMLVLGLADMFGVFSIYRGASQHPWRMEALSS